MSIQKPELPLFLNTFVRPLFLSGIIVVYLFSFLGCVFCIVCLRLVSCAQWCMRPWVVFFLIAPSVLSTRLYTCTYNIENTLRYFKEFQG
jgi:hypothetical protein